MHPPKETVERFPREWDSVSYRGESSYLPHPRPRAAYAAMIAELDDHVGRVLAALDRHGLAQRTLVIFTSDNGTTHAGATNSPFHVGGVDAKFFNSTAGLRGYKGSVYEGGIRVPMIVRFPGRVKAGSVNHTPGYFADWFPTLCDAVGLEEPPGLDGNSLWAAMRGKRPVSERRPMVWVFPEYGGQVAVRMGKMKAVRQKLATKAPGPWEVYDITKDPAETQDLAASRPEVIRKVEAILRRETDANPKFPVRIPGVND
jgi:arylsulfatase A-like enzyme